MQELLGQGRQNYPDLHSCVGLWTLGCDARKFSENHNPGEILSQAAPNVLYIYNPDNCPNSSVEWLEHNPMKRVLVPGASHSISVDKPDELSRIMLSDL